MWICAEGKIINEEMNNNAGSDWLAQPKRPMRRVKLLTVWWLIMGGYKTVNLKNKRSGWSKRNTYRAAVTLKHDKCHNNGSRGDHSKNQENTFVSVLPSIHSFTTLSVYTLNSPPSASVVWSSQAVPVKGTGGESTASQIDWHTHLHTV